MSNALPRIAILDDYQKVAFNFADWTSLKERATIDVYTDTISDEDSLAIRLEPYHIICAMRERTKFTASLLDRLPRLGLIATTGLKNAGIDVVHARSKGILVSGTSGGGNSTTEHIWALILATARHLAVEHAGVKGSRQLWQSTIPVGLQGKTLGLIGVGHLGQKTARIAEAFDMKVIGWSPNLTLERAKAAGVGFAKTKAELLQASDIVSIHMVLTEKTRHLITSEDLTLMKPTAIFINTSRGPLVDEDGLVEALRRKQIAAAGLDVFDLEPLPLDHPLRGLDNVTLSPHMGYVSDDNYKVFWSQTVENIVAFLDGFPKRLIEA